MSLVFVAGGCRKEPRGEVREVIFEVRQGETTSQIAERLDELNIISNPRRFSIAARLAKLDTKLQSGVYRLHTYMDEDSVLEVLSSGSIATISVTIPEGLTLTGITERLVKACVVDSAAFYAAATDSSLLSEYNVPFGSFEGILYPDTYKFPVVVSEEMVVRIMASRFFDVAGPFMKNLSLDTLVIMASIVEREAYLDSERRVVASVFWNRLHKGMALESCATVEYALPEHKENLTYADLRISSPYNTYLNQGLPPGPICSPGKASLSAAANPAKTDYLYFVSKGDGSHHFSRTAAEHERMKLKIKNTR